MNRLHFLWTNHRLATLFFALALVATLAFATRSAMYAVYWSDPAHRDQRVQPWMTPRYVAHSWKLSPVVMGSALGQVDMPDRRRTLQDLADERGVPVEDLIGAIEAAIAFHRNAVAPQ